MKTQYLKVLGILLAVATVSIAVAEGDRRDGRHADRHDAGMTMSGERLDRMASYLGLDDVQRQSMENIMTAARPEFEALQARREANREAMASLDSGNEADALQFDNLAAEAGQLVTDGLVLRDRVQAEVETVLTAEQREKMSEMRSSRQGFRGKRNNRRGQNRQGSDDDVS